MTTIRRLLTVLALAACFTGAHGAPSVPRPYLAYLCAAGGQRGTTVTIVAGGQNLRGIKRVLVSGGGVHATVKRFGRVSTALRTEQRSELGRKLRLLAAEKARAEIGDPRGRRADRRPAGGKARRDAAPKKAKDAKAGAAAPVELPDHPLLADLESLSLLELRKVMYEFLDPEHRAQTSSQIGEIVEIELTIDADAAPGDRELRVGSQLGLSNPMLFEVGMVEEFLEQEPNDFETSKQEVLDLPRVINGQVGFKDIDRFRFRAKRGQKLVIAAEARRLVPYLADAVPGWFQATLSLYDSKGIEIGYADDYRFDPDPVILFEPPEDGEYLLEIRDAVYRGREDFVYRISIGERPFITSMFPLGGMRGTTTTAAVEGWNLPWDHVLLDTGTGGREIRSSAWCRDVWLTNRMAYAVDDIAAQVEVEPNDTAESAQLVTLPRIVDGRIARAGEADVFRFRGRAGQEIVAEVRARRLGSPLDSLIHLTDAAGVVLAWNDDQPDPTAGLVTHQADSYVRVKLPADGDYFLRLTDAQGKGGAAHAYRLRLGPPRPDFTVIVTPASINVPAATHVPLTVHAIRHDGFEGAIDLTLVDAPAGFFLSGARIPAGRDRVQITLATSPVVPDAAIPLEIAAHAVLEGRRVTHAAVPAEDMMQAFGLRHLVAAEQLLVDVRKSWRRTPPMRLVEPGPVRIPAGGTARVRIAATALPPLDSFDFVIGDAPAGVTIRKVTTQGGQLVLELAAERGKAEIGLADNLVIEAYTTTTTPEPAKRGKGKAGKAKATDKAAPKAKQPAPATSRRVFAGVLPAVPFTIVAE